MDDNHRWVLRTCRIAILEAFEQIEREIGTCHDFIEEATNRSILTRATRCEVDAIVNIRRKFQHLLDVLPRRGDQAFGAFLDMLHKRSEYCNTYAELHELLSLVEVESVKGERYRFKIQNCSNKRLHGMLKELRDVTTSTPTPNEIPIKMLDENEATNATKQPSCQSVETVTIMKRQFPKDISLALLNEMVHDEDILSIAESIGYCWEMIGCYLDINQRDMEEISSGHNRTVQKIILMLKRWRNSQTSPTFRKLFDAFDEVPSCVTIDKDSILKKCFANMRRRHARAGTPPGTAPTVSMSVASPSSIARTSTTPKPDSPPTHAKVVTESEKDFNSDGRKCCICMDRDQNMVITPCNHLCTCERCYHDYRDQGNNICPLCRAVITGAIKVFT